MMLANYILYLLFGLFAVPAVPAAAALQTTCPSGGTAQWIHAYSLDGAKIAANGCPGDMRVMDATSHIVGQPNVKVCGRGNHSADADIYQKGAFIAKGYEYNAIRGNVGGYVMGSPDSFRVEGPRNVYGINDAFVDGVVFSRWDTSGQGKGREHVATYGAGLSYNVRSFSYYQNGNCICHAGTDLPPDWIGQDYFCDSGLRGGKVPLESSTADAGGNREACFAKYSGKTAAELQAMKINAPHGYAICDSASKCQDVQCPGFFTNSKWYANGEHDLMWKGDRVKGMLCKGDRAANDADFTNEASDGSPAASRIFGSFHHRTDVKGKFFDPVDWSKDALEVRIMAGQGSATAGGGDGNEDQAIVEMDVWIHGCKIPDPAPRPPGAGASMACGDGVREDWEQCDLGAGNGWDAKCSLACTTWNPETCTRFGGADTKCPAPPAKVVVPEDAPGKAFLGSKLLPRWVKIAKVNYDDLFQGKQAMGDGSCGDAKAACPGDLKRFVVQDEQDKIDCAALSKQGKACGDPVLRSICAPPMSMKERSDGPASFKLQIPGGTSYAAVRGRVVTHAKGHMDAFTDVAGLPTDFSAGGCYKKGQCDDKLFEGVMTDSNAYRVPKTDGDDKNIKPCPASNAAWCAANKFPQPIDGRYVDGISITYGDPYSTTNPKMRKHVWSLAAGASRDFADSRTPNSGALFTSGAYATLEAKFPTGAPGLTCSSGQCKYPTFAFGPKPLDASGAKTVAAETQELAIHQNCWASDGHSVDACYIGNCACHRGTELRKDLVDTTGNKVNATVIGQFDPPSFVGDDFYCDGGSGAADGFYFQNPFKSTRMFTTADICDASGKKQDDAFWKAKGGPGHFKKALDEVTAEPLEFRLMTGADSFYESIGVADIDLEVCVCKAEAWNSPTTDPTKEGFIPMSPFECYSLCEGTWDPIKGTEAEYTAQIYPKVEKNYLSDALKILGIALAILGCIMCFACFVWVMAFKSHPIVKASQPFFLNIVLLGAGMSVVAIFFLAKDDNGIEPTIVDGKETWPEIDFYCQMVPWFYGLGFVLSFASLFAKTWRVKMLFNNKKLKKVVVKIKDAMKLVVIGVVVEGGILLAWQIDSPMKWKRFTLKEENIHGRLFIVETGGHCTSERALNYVIPLIIIQFFAYLIGCVLCYQTRNVNTKFQEAKWISLAMFNNIQIFVLAIPLIYMVFDAPAPYFIIKLFVIFLNDIGLILVIFLPKMIAMRTLSDADLKTTTGGTSGTAATTSPSTAKASSANHHSGGSGPGSPVAPVSSVVVVPSMNNKAEEEA
jgi:hypothetical protein